MQHYRPRRNIQGNLKSLWTFSKSLCRDISLRNKRYHSLTSVEPFVLKWSIELDQQTQLKKLCLYWLIVAK